MGTQEDLLSRAKEARHLTSRIHANRIGQKTELEQWIFAHTILEPGARVLELCCGTGRQTKRMAEAVGVTGMILALDASREALDEMHQSISADLRDVVVPLQSDMDHAAATATDAGTVIGDVDLIFCAYGLYYSKGPAALLDSLLPLVRADGRIVVVGPHGRNNGPLFDLLVDSKVQLPEYVLYTSRDFMYHTVLPWGAKHTSRMVIHTLVNPVEWTKPEQVLDYWRGSTFYDENREAEVSLRLTEHFAAHGSFKNEKNVMMVEMFLGG